MGAKPNTRAWTALSKRAATMMGVTDWSRT
jgi:hypothetical protein